jgi:uncharacterized membrane protein YheB (UPF0754 family)
MRGYIITWAVSVISACIFGAAWIYTHPFPREERFIVIDLNKIITEEISKLEKEIKPDMTQEKREELKNRLASTTQKLDSITKAMAEECGCAVVNAAAIIANGSRTIQDMTDRVSEMIAAQERR